jgi:hypothetical protein
MDCFVASLLAMTPLKPRGVARHTPGNRIVSMCGRSNRLIRRTFRYSCHIAGNKFNSVEITRHRRDDRSSEKQSSRV